MTIQFPHQNSTLITCYFRQFLSLSQLILVQHVTGGNFSSEILVHLTLSMCKPEFRHSKSGTDGKCSIEHRAFCTVASPPTPFSVGWPPTCLSVRVNEARRYFAQAQTVTDNRFLPQLLQFTITTTGRCHWRQSSLRQ